MALTPAADTDANFNELTWDLFLHAFLFIQLNRCK